MSTQQLLLLRVTTLPFEQLEDLRARNASPLIEDAIRLEDSLSQELLFLCDTLHRLAGPGGGLDSERAQNRLALLALRRDLHNSREIPAARCDRVRVTLGEELAARLSSYLAERRRRDELVRAGREAFAVDQAAAAVTVLRAAGQPLFEEGLRLTSRSLLASVRSAAAAAVEPSRWGHWGKWGHVGHDERHALSKAAAYLGRFATKTSPNGVFCATALAHVDHGPGAARVEGDSAPLRIDLLLSVAEARKVAACLAAAPETMPAVTPRPNPTLRAVDGGWTFWRPVTPRRADDDEILSRVKDHPVLRIFLEEASSGSLTAPGLVAEVARHTGLPADELMLFLAELAERGILLAEVEIPYTSRRPLLDLAARCRRAGCSAPWLAEIEEVEKEIDRAAPGCSLARIEAMNRIESRLLDLPTSRSLSTNDLFRADAASGLRVSVPESVVEDLQAAIDQYARLFGTMYPQPDHIAPWATRFLSRYPAGTDVELLDIYHGLFEPRELERPASFPRPAGTAPEFFARRALQAAASGQSEVSLDHEDWKMLAPLSPMAPASRWMAGVLFQVAGRSVEAIDAGQYRVVLNALFSGAGLAFARFAHLHGEPIVQELKQQWSGFESASSKSDGALLAEVTYMHGGRTANAGLRPSILSHEIELPGEKASGGAVVIPLSDLCVRYDSGAGRFNLRSRKLCVEIVPVINSGISPEGLVAFLVAIGRQGWQPLSYFPGFDVEGVWRWPRFTTGRVVLFRARWVFDASGAPEHSPPPTDVAGADFFAGVARWRRAHQLPRHVFVHSEDDPKPFYVDLESPPFVELLRRLLCSPSARVLHVTEMLPGPDEMWVADRRGRYASEFLIHLRSGMTARC